MQQLDQAQMREMFGVGERAQAEWFNRAERGWAALKDSAEHVLHRSLRAKALEVCGDVSSIIRNCQADPDDIREEPAFPMMVERLVALLDDYAKTASLASLTNPTSSKVKTALHLLENAHDGFAKLLQVMQANDNKDFLLRTTAMSSIFRRIPDAVEEPPDESG